MTGLAVAVVILAVVGGLGLIGGLLYADYANECDHQRWLARRQRWAARQQGRDHG